jgi:hypothetical protein
VVVSIRSRESGPRNPVRICHAGHWMVAFNSEIYLRRLGERLLDDPDQQHQHPRSPLAGPAGALVAEGTIDADQAWRVIDDYRTATNIRTGEPRFLHFGPPSRRREAGRLAPRQTMVIDQELPVGWGQLLLRDLGITAEGGILRYRRRLGAQDASQLARFSRSGGFPWTGTPPEIVDSDGNRPVVRSGSRGRDSEDRFDGELELDGTIAPDAAWLQVDGTRVLTVARRAGRSASRRSRTRVRWSGFSGDVSPWPTGGLGSPPTWSR